MNRDRARFTLGGPAVIFLCLVVIFSLVNRRFFTLSNAENIIRQTSVLALAAFGQTLVILLGGIDLSIGAVMGLASCTAALSMVGLGLPPWAAALLAVSLGALCGLINGVVTNYVGLNPFIATFGMWGMALGVALVISDESVIFGFPENLKVLHNGRFLGLPAPLWLIAGTGAAIHVFLRYTPAGIATYAIGGNQEAARLSGIRVLRHKTLVYLVSGLLAGFSGLIFLARTNAAQAVDTIGFEFDSVCAVVLGGTALSGGRGGVKQTALGAFLLIIMRNGLNMIGANLYIQLVVVGLVLILAYIAEDQLSKHRLPELLKVRSRRGRSRG